MSVPRTQLLDVLSAMAGTKLVCSHREGEASKSLVLLFPATVGRALGSSLYMKRDQEFHRQPLPLAPTPAAPTHPVRSIEEEAASSWVM